MSGPYSYQTVKLSHGKHDGPENGACVMEVVSMLAREPFSDDPECVCPALTSFLRVFNDQLTDEERHVLWPYTTRVIGTASDGKTQERMFRFADWAVREMAPIGLRAQGFEGAASRLEELSPVRDKVSARKAADAATTADATYAAAAATTAEAARTAYAAYAAATAADATAKDRSLFISSCLQLLEEMLPDDPVCVVDELAWNTLDAVRGPAHV